MNNDSKVWTAAYELYCLLSEGENSEEKYQSYFEMNPLALKILGYDEVKSYEKSSGRQLPFDSEKNYRPEPDFIGVENKTGRLAIIELKTPFVGKITTSRKDGNRSKFKADTEAHISQASEYVESISSREAARNKILSEFEVNKISSYEIILIYGLSQENNCAEVARLSSSRSPACKIVFYDELLDDLLSTYALPRKDSQSRPGWCLVSHVKIDKDQLHDRAYLGSYGDGGKNSLSILLENESIIFECIDAEGRTHSLFSRVEVNSPTYLRFEFSNDEHGIYMSLNVNNVEQDLRSGSRILDFNPSFFSYVLGAGPQGESGAAFLMMEEYSVDKTMDIKDKLGSYHYFKRRLGEKIGGLYFKPESYMTRSEEGNLIQEHDHLKPILHVEKQ